MLDVSCPSQLPVICSDDRHHSLFNLIDQFLIHEGVSFKYACRVNTKVFILMYSHLFSFEMLWPLMSELFPLILVYSRFLSRFLPFSQTYNLSCSCIDIVINAHYVIIHQLLFFNLVTLFHLNNYY